MLKAIIKTFCLKCDRLGIVDVLRNLGVLAQKSLKANMRGIRKANCQMLFIVSDFNNEIKMTSLPREEGLSSLGLYS